MDMPQQLRTTSGDERISNSYTPGFEYLSLNSCSPLTSNLGNLAMSNQLSLNQKARDHLTSPLRFCIQAKDRFVVRVVKVTVKQLTNYENSQSSQYDQLKSVWRDSTQRQNLQKILLETSKENNAVFIGFQAQLPAVVMEYILKSTSADQVNIPNDNQSFQHTNIGKGVRLTFSCPLTGNGLKIEDFYSGSVYQRLESWEKNSSKSGLLNDVLIALKKTVDLLLEQIQKNGLLTVIPEVDYIFYPFTPQALFSQKPLHSTVNSSTNTESSRVDSFVSRSPSGSLAPLQVPSATSSPIAIPGARARPTNPNPMMALMYHGPQRQQNPLLASLINSSRPLSAYGSCFDGNSASIFLERQISLSADESGSPIRYMSECSPYEAQMIKDLTQTSTRTSSINSINQTDYNETSTSNCRYASASRSPSSAWWSSRLGSPICATAEVNEPDLTRSPQTTHEPPPPAICLTANTNSNNNSVRSNHETPFFQMPIENEPMNIVSANMPLSYPSIFTNL
ncbi:unnamed protein product [Hymenolepis diminuta]|uniref:Uncharacterized protein n=1 Tax=Hymenolepis diminuta TaxID=6216 RepID=A0A0R3SDZ5_HYMDI|nr:unnamed protein product [Hymenolepis diminuta]